MNVLWLNFTLIIFKNVGTRNEAKPNNIPCVLLLLGCNQTYALWLMTFVFDCSKRGCQTNSTLQGKTKCDVQMPSIYCILWGRQFEMI